MNECGSVATLLWAAGFELSYQVPPEVFELELGECDVEEYLGWEIQSNPFAVIHCRTGYAWVAMFPSLEKADRVKVLIRKGIEMDFVKAMEVKL